MHGMDESVADCVCFVPAVDGLNFNSAYDMLTLVISELYKKHLYLLDSDKLDSLIKKS